MHIQKKSTLQPFLEQGETSHCIIAGAPLTKHGNEVGGDARRSPSFWSGHSSPSHFAGAAFEPFSHHPEYDVNTSDE